MRRTCSPHSLLIRSITSLCLKIKRSTVKRVVTAVCLLVAVGLSLEIQEHQLQGRELFHWNVNATSVSDPAAAAVRPTRKEAAQSPIEGVSRSELFRQMELHMKNVHGLSVQVREAPKKTGSKKNGTSCKSVDSDERKPSFVINMPNPTPTTHSMPTGHPRVAHEAPVGKPTSPVNWHEKELRILNAGMTSF